MRLLGLEERHGAGNCVSGLRRSTVPCSAKGRSEVREPRPGLGGVLALMVGVDFSVITPSTPQRSRYCTQTVHKVPWVLTLWTSGTNSSSHHFSFKAI